jgi:hypothetical protein
MLTLPPLIQHHSSHLLIICALLLVLLTHLDRFSNHQQTRSMVNLPIQGGGAHTTMPMDNNLDLLLGLLTLFQVHTLLLTKAIMNNSFLLT